MRPGLQGCGGLTCRYVRWLAGLGGVGGLGCQNVDDGVVESASGAWSQWTVVECWLSHVVCGLFGCQGLRFSCTPPALLPVPRRGRCQNPWDHGPNGDAPTYTDSDELRLTPRRITPRRHSPATPTRIETLPARQSPPRSKAKFLKGHSFPFLGRGALHVDSRAALGTRPNRVLGLVFCFFLMA